MLKIGDAVIHIDYPCQKGLIISQARTWPNTGYVFLVRWENKSQSRHIGYALKRVMGQS